MTIHSITGLMSGGKTADAVSLGYMDYLQGNTIYSNLDLMFPYVKINVDYLIYLARNGVDLKNITFILDEFWLYMDSRRASSSISVCLNWFFLQSSKGNNIKIYLTSQTLRQLDNRVRENQHFWSSCERMILYENKLYPIPSKYKDIRKLDSLKDDPIALELAKLLVIKIDVRSQTQEGYFKKDKLRILHPQPFYMLYNTEQKVVNEKIENIRFINESPNLNNFINNNKISFLNDFIKEDKNNEPNI